jgi:ribose transport system substrate-binding protein
MSNRISIIALTLSNVALLFLPTSRLIASDTQNKPWTVGYAAAGLIDELQVAWSDGLKKVIQDAGGTVSVVDSQNKIGKQISDVEDLLTQKIDFLVINPVDEAGIVPAIEAANKAGVPVVTIDRAAAGGKVVVHVTFDNYKAGYDAGVYIAEQNNGKGKVAQLEGQAGTSVAKERGQGFKDAIAKYPGMAIVFEKPTDWTTTQGQVSAEDLLVAFPDVVGIWAHADSIIMGAVQAIEAAKPKQKMVTVGMGMFAGGPEAIKAHRLSASWELFPAELGKIAGQAVVDLHNGKQAGPVIKTPMVFVTADNIDRYLKK